MAPSEFPSGRQDEQPYAEQEQQPTQLDANGQLMERVLAETLAAADGQGHLHPEEILGIRQVANRYAGQSLQCRPMVTDLVQSLLSLRFPSLADDPARWQRMTLAIAQTLWDDPASRGHLQSLWQHLHESEAI